MKHRNSHLLVGYWGRIRNGRPVPDQTDIDPREIKRMLSNVFILDASDLHRVTYRLAGTALCERYGGELKGESYYTKWSMNSERQNLMELFRKSLRNRKPFYIQSLISTANADMAEQEIVFAPITFGETLPQRFIGLSQILTDLRPIAGRSIAFERLINSEWLTEFGGTEKDIAVSTPIPAMPASKAFLSAPTEKSFTYRPHPKAPHLRLVVDPPAPRG